MKPQKSLRARALDILSRREISRAELKRKLAPHAQSEEEVDGVLAELAERRWQSDERYAEAYIHSKSSRQGSRRMRQDLLQKGVDADTIREFLPDRDSELENAVRVVRKKFKQPAADFQERQKQVRFMAYRGFDMEIIQKALKCAWEEDEDGV
ncbi:MAG: recombination regulator RecX [Neisseria sp.]|nr:recombination regulator RecX [Neisseria sp.]